MFGDPIRDLPSSDQSCSNVTSIISAVALVIAIILPFLTLLVLKKGRALRSDEGSALELEYRPTPRLKFNWPFAIDIIVNAFKADKQGLLLEFFLDLISQTGNTFEHMILGARGIDTQDPDNIEAILSTQFSEFDIGARQQNFRPLLGHGIFTQNGPSWRRSRDMLRPQFMRSKSEYLPHIQSGVEKLIDLLETKASSGPIDLQPLFFRLTLDVTTTVFFGKSVNSLEKQADGVGNDFARAFNEAQHELARRGRLGDFYWLLGGRSFRQACKVVHDFVDDIVAESLARNKTDPNRSEKGKFVFLDALTAETQDTKIIRDHLVNILLAGRDTTACLLSWTFRLLADHPQIQAKLRNDCVAVANGTLSRDTLKGMKYLQCVLKEVLRLYPSVPLNSRTALKTTTLPVGGGKDGRSPILVRKGEAVGYCAYSMHRRRDLYGEDADRFIPERWEENPASGPNLKDIKWAYIPFNAGPRVCLGQEFALLEASYAVARILQTFSSIEPERTPAGTSVFNDEKSITLVVASRDGCRVVLNR